MPSQSPSQTEAISMVSVVNDVIRLHPATTAVFNRFGIDACCGGAVSIDEAAVRDGADPAVLLDSLNDVIAAPPGSAGRAA